MRRIIPHLAKTALAKKAADGTIRNIASKLFGYRNDALLDYDVAVLCRLTG
jgi:hypothetical protein